MNLGLDNKLALVTGSTQGIGYATAKLLLAEGARVIVNGRRPELVERAVRALSNDGAVQGIAADLSGAKGANKLLDALAAAGPLDILVNNVGYFEVKEYTAISDEDWLAMFQLNVRSHRIPVA